jgi:rubredoxin
MIAYECGNCGYLYDPEKGDPVNGLPVGTKWEDIPADWKCPDCGMEKAQFEQIGL